MQEKLGAAILTGCHVLALADNKASFCLKKLEGMGAEITPVDPERDPDGFRRALENADIFLEAGHPGFLDSLGMGYQDLSRVNPRLIMVSLTPFGQNGPHKNFKASDLTLQALGGWLSVTGEPGKPLKLYGQQAYHTAGLFALNGILLALHQRHETGRGQHIDISILECVAATLDHVLVRYFYEGIVSGRQGSRTWNNTFDVLPCADGFILISIHRQWETLVDLMAAGGMADDLADEKYLARDERDNNISHILEVMRRWTLKHQTAELEEQGQLMHFPWAAVHHE